MAVVCLSPNQRLIPHLSWVPTYVQAALQLAVAAQFHDDYFVDAQAHEVERLVAGLFAFVHGGGSWSVRDGVVSQMRSRFAFKVELRCRDRWRLGERGTATSCIGSLALRHCLDLLLQHPKQVHLVYPKLS